MANWIIAIYNFGNWLGRLVLQWYVFKVKRLGTGQGLIPCILQAEVHA